MEEHKKMEKRGRERPTRQSVLKVLIGVLAVILAAAVICLVVLLNMEKSDEQPTQPQQPVQQEAVQQPVDVPTVPEVEETFASLQTRYGSVQLTSRLVEHIRHFEVTEEGVTIEVFNMLTDEGEKELFRICFGNSLAGDLFGYLHGDSGDISVTVTVTSHTEDEFRKKDDYRLYQELMEQLNTVLDSIRGCETFSTQRSADADNIQPQSVQLKYWTVQIPGNMTWEEKTEGSVYQVDFYGMVNGEKRNLYSIVLGEENPESVIGVYTADGTDRTVSVKTYDASAQLAQMDDNAAQVYGTMMDSINEVLQVITVDKNFK